MAQLTHSSSLLDTEGLQQLSAARIAIVYTEWNDTIVAAQLEGCRRVLAAWGATVVRELVVPGAFELPFGCKHAWQSSAGNDNKPDAIIAFGAVIRGGTPHFDYVCQAATDGILRLNLTLPVPVIFGVLTLDTTEQAWERLGGVHGHKGEEAALTALKMVKMMREK